MKDIKAFHWRSENGIGLDQSCELSGYLLMIKSYFSASSTNTLISFSCKLFYMKFPLTFSSLRAERNKR